MNCDHICKMNGHLLVRVRGGHFSVPFPLLLLPLLLLLSSFALACCLPFYNLLSVIEQHSVQEPVKVTTCHLLEDGFKAS